MDWLERALFFILFLAIYIPLGVVWEAIVLPRLLERTLTNHFWYALGALSLGVLSGIASFWLWPGRLLGTGAPSGISTMVLPIGAALAVLLVARTRSHGSTREHPLLRPWLAFDFAFAAAVARFILVSRAAL